MLINPHDKPLGPFPARIPNPIRDNPAPAPTPNKGRIKLRKR